MFLNKRSNIGSFKRTLLSNNASITDLKISDLHELMTTNNPENSNYFFCIAKITSIGYGSGLASIFFKDFDTFLIEMSEIGLELNDIKEVYGKPLIQSLDQLKIVIDNNKKLGDFASQQIYLLYESNVCDDLEGATNFHKKYFIRKVEDDFIFDREKHSFIHNGMRHTNKIVIGSCIYHKPFFGEKEGVKLAENHYFTIM